MADWADAVEKELMKWDLKFHEGAIAEALRKARLDALEDAAMVAETCRKSTEAANIRALKDKT